LPGRDERWGYGGHVGAPMKEAARPSSRSATALPGRDERWGYGGHVGAPMMKEDAWS